MGKVYRKIEENALRDLLVAAHNYWALECGGVDNWDFRSEAIHAYVNDCIITDEQYYDSIEDIAAEDLENYEVLLKN